MYVLTDLTKKDDKEYDTIVGLTSMDDEIAMNVPQAESKLIMDAVEDNKELEEMLFGLAKYQYEQPHYKAQSGSDESQNGAGQPADKPANFADFDQDVPY